MKNGNQMTLIIEFEFRIDFGQEGKKCLSFSHLNC